MFRKRLTNRRRRAPMRRRRAPRKRTTGIRQIEKVDKYVFRPTSQYLISNAIGTMVQINPVGTSTAPVSFGSLAAIPSASTIPGYYDFGASAEFNLANLTTQNSILTRYDNYRIKQVTLNLELLTGGSVTPETSGTGALGIFPTVWAFADQDDANPPTNITQVASRYGVKRFKFGEKGKMSFSITVNPKVGLKAGPAGAPDGVVQAPQNVWLDSGASSPAPYYGIKLWFSDVDMSGLTNYGFRCNWVYVVEAKGTQNLF